MIMKYLGLILCTFSINLYAENGVIENLYKRNNIKGALLIESYDGKQKYQYNINDNKNFIPASTFKIPNTLIILEEGLIKGVSEIIIWDKVKREYKLWNQDQTLKTAFQYSCVWCYQRYAKKIGDKKYREYLRKFNYGNQLTGNNITSFWLDGDLRISVNSQVDFLRKLYTEKLPIQKKHIRTLKNIMLSKKNGVKLWSKTGWTGKNGWYVGYLIVNNKTWFFANHIEIRQNSDLKLRKKLTIEAFKALNIIQQ